MKLDVGEQKVSMYNLSFLFFLINQHILFSIDTFYSPKMFVVFLSFLKQHSIRCMPNKVFFKRKKKSSLIYMISHVLMAGALYIPSFH
jgi:hypothetical protein